MIETMARFIERNRIKLTSKYVDHTTDSSGWPHHLYRVTLRNRQGLRMSISWRQGDGLTDDPDVESVLDCLALDASSYENAGSFEEWAREYGFDPDSRKAEHDYKLTKNQTERLRRWLGSVEFDALLWHTDHI